MLIATGAALVLISWAVILVGCVAVGLPLATIGHSTPLCWADVRRSLWWGLLVLASASVAINLVFPLASGAAAAIVLAIALMGTIASLVLLKRRRWIPTLTWSLSSAVVTCACAAAAVYLAIAALGPVTNYDSGLYHLGAIKYSADFATVPGLANLYFPFGYSTGEFSLGALLGNGPWAGEGFRLLNGLVIAAVLVDLVSRMVQRRRGAGAMVLLAGSACLLVTMVALSDYWVTSPSQDSSVFAITVAASAAVAEAVSSRRAWVAEGSTALAASVLLLLIRPTSFAYALAVAAVMAVLVVRRWGSSPRWWSAGILIGGTALSAALVSGLRDYRLSGWFMYPLSLLRFDVPWVAADPVENRTATLGFHRDPNDLWNAAHNWQWVGPWISRLPQQWETYLLVALIIAGVMLVVAAIALAHPFLTRGALLAVIPSVAMVAFWWLFTPPSFRFAWGPVFTCLTVPMGWALWRLSTAASRPSWRLVSRWVATLSFAVPVLVVVALSATLRLQWGEISQERMWAGGIPYRVAPLVSAPTDAVTLSSGLVVQAPRMGEQCWAKYPLCTPTPAGGLALRGTGIADGFLP